MTENVPAFKIELSHEAISHVKKLTRWTFFLSILGFIYMGFIVLAGFSFGFIMESLGRQRGANTPPSLLIGLIYVVIAILYFFPLLYLYKFSVSAKQSVQTSSTLEFTAALKYLTSHYTYLGVLAIVGIACMALGLFVAVLISLLK